MSHDQLTQSASASASGLSRDQNEIPVKCGPISRWVTPIEFESLGGKAKSGKWKQSVRTNNNVSISVHLSTLGFDVYRSHPHSDTAVPPSSSLSSTVSIFDASSIVSPLLAFEVAQLILNSCCSF